MDILSHITDSGGFYGAEKVLLNLMEEQNNQGFHPQLISIGDIGVPEKAIEIECTRKGIDLRTLRFRNGFNIHGASQILATLKTLHSDIIHSHLYKSDILIGLYPRYLRKIPMVTTIHGWTSTRLFSKMRLYEYVGILALKRVDRVIVVSKAMQKHPRLRMFGVRATVIPNGIPPLDFDEHLFKTQYPKIAGTCTDKFRILAIGRLSPEKGFDLLVQAVARLNDRGIDSCLVVVGEGGEFSKLSRLAEQERIADRVHLIGYVRDAYKMIPYFDTFALSSYTEGLPITLLEAMQGAIPIVATAVGEIPEVMDHGRCGHLVPPGNMIELSNAIEKIYKDRQDAKRKAEAARQRALSEYSVERMARRYQEQYRQALGPTR